MRLAETTTYALTAAGTVGERLDYVQKDDELWLRGDGELFILLFRMQFIANNTSLSVTSRTLTHLGAARYDYSPVWKTRQTTQSRAIVEEGWLEILGKPWHQDPYESVKRLLATLSAGASVPSGVHPPVNVGSRFS
jgi:hypothetical protein